MTKQEIGKLGLIVGGGDFPISVIDYCIKSSIPLIVAGIKGFYKEDLTYREGFSFFEFRMGNIGLPLKKFKEAGVTHVSFIGSVRRPSLSSVFPDVEGFKLLKHVSFLRGGDDVVLRGVRSYLEQKGFSFVGVHEIDASLTYDHKGTLVGSLSDGEKQDIHKGVTLLDALSPFDIGQSVIVKDQYILGIEGFEGTDALIERCAAYENHEGAILVKKSKTTQDLSLDMPSLGRHTIEMLATYGMRGVAVEAGRVLMHDRDEVMALARKLGVFVHFF